MLQKRGQGGQAAEAMAPPSASTAAAAAAALFSSPRKGSPDSSAVDSQLNASSPAAMGSPIADGEGPNARNAKRTVKPPITFAAEQAQQALTGGLKRKRESSTTAATGSSSAAARRRQKRAKNGLSASADYSQTICQLCQGADHDDKVLLCDECDMGFHIFCLSPPLAQIPATDWYEFSEDG
jgi:histone demethylase JARID1